MRESGTVAAAGEKHVLVPMRNESIRTVANHITVVRTVAAMLLAVAALHQASTVLLVAAYLTYWVGDILDGLAARRLDQETRIGAILDIVSDRACTTLAAAAFVVVAPEVVVPVAVFLVQFCVVDLMLSLGFLWFDILGPNDFHRVDPLLHRLNWSPPAKALNTALVVLLCLAGLVWVAAAAALAVLGLKVWCLLRLRQVMSERLGAPDGA